MADVKEKIVPPQYEGGQKDITHKFTATDDDDARKLFFLARNRLLDINNWHKVAAGISGRFTLTDQTGRELRRTAEKNDYFKIDVPGPGSIEGGGYDWAFIEAIEEKSDSTGPYESIALRARPSENPTKGENVAHFFKDDATSSFIVERKGRELSASVIGRNEMPNTSTSNVIDKVRNAIVGSSAIAGLAKIQWKSLVKGLLSTEK